MEIKLNVTLDATPSLLAALNNIALALAGGKTQETPATATAKKATKQTAAETTVLTELPPASEPAPKVAPQLQDKVDTTPTPPKAGGMNGVVNFDTMRDAAKAKAQKGIQDAKILPAVVKGLCDALGVKNIGAVPDDKIGAFILDLDEAIANG